jgi:hypothetical protein
VNVWGGRDIGRGRGTVPRGMGAIVEAVLGEFGMKELIGTSSAGAREGGTVDERYAYDGRCVAVWLRCVE